MRITIKAQNTPAGTQLFQIGVASSPAEPARYPFGDYAPVDQSRSADIGSVSEMRFYANDGTNIIDTFSVSNPSLIDGSYVADFTSRELIRVVDKSSPLRWLAIGAVVLLAISLVKKRK